jgi:acetoin utilization deacetylase AcuC-like enzyme
MMFIYNKDTQLNLIEYGIEIPLLGKRGRLVFEYIKKNFKNNQIIQQDIINCSKENLLLAHSPEFIESILSDPTLDLLKTFELIAEDGSYNRYNPSLAINTLDHLVQRILKQIGGTILTCEHALKSNFAFHIGGGLHHAMTDTGRGFCLVNDIVIAARFMQKKYNLNNILVIDVDAHKGDGTAQITKTDNSITTFSIHMKDNWPMDTGIPDDPWFIPSDVDIPVTNDDNYIKKLELGLKKLKDFPTPDLCIVVQGSDPYEHDELESSNQINLTLEKMLERDKLVYNHLKDRLIPQAYVMSGGYGLKAHEPYIEFLKFLKVTS